ncbi:MAG: hypothetical protein ACPG4N_00220 [Gammaproteobacteria bacterium]
MSDSHANRRRFLGACGKLLGLMSLAPGAMAVQRPVKRYERVLLTDEHGRPLDCAELSPEHEYIFHYPYSLTPCFLLDLGRPLAGGKELSTKDGEPYRWQGGVGPGRSLVAFSAICAHRMTHPTPNVSFIGYRKQEIGYLDSDYELRHRAGVIQCCSERSIYDPANGAEVLGGPADQPLAAIELEYTEQGELYATGVYGGDLFDRYFETFNQRLILEYQTLDVRQPVQARSKVLSVDGYTRRRMDCSGS